MIRELEQEKQTFDDTLIAISTCRKECKWDELYKLVKSLERVAFRIYMMTDTFSEPTEKQKTIPPTGGINE